MLRLSRSAYAGLVGHAYDGLPDEACGLLVGDPSTENEARSSKLYTVPAKEFLRIDRAAGAEGREIIGVVHSHTHTDAYPSPTDVAQAPDPTWHYVIVSLRDDAPVVRSYRIVDENISEERVVVEG
jgi:[CysO sulfur-carrier protein]-S-L-cysteine hydrolase